MKNVLLALCLLISISFQLFGQKNFTCSSSELHRIKLTEDFLFTKKINFDNQSAADFFKNNQTESRPLAAYTLPVVIHIIHENGAENISNAQAERAIDFLNQAFGNSGYYNPQTGVNTDIQFCLAKRSPDNEASTGINRINSPLTTFNYFADDINLKNLSRWEPRDYINIWVVKEICNSNGCGVAGYAYLPAAHGEDFDGIVLESNYMGSAEAETSVLVHEMGHYLGLYHTFQGGCSNADCMQNGDQVCDTPPDNTTARVPCADPSNSCNTDTQSGFTTDQNDMINNFMDYSNLECYNAFTQGQTDRMHFFIEGRRKSLLESPGCEDPCDLPVTALFSPQNNQTIQAGGQINFTNLTQNASKYNWKIDGQSVSNSTNFTRIFSDIGIFEITLVAENNLINCRKDSFTIQVNVVCPVIPDFEVSGNFTTVNGTLNFTNQSQNADSYIWLVNDSPQATTTNFDFTSPDAGIFEVCLEAANNLCFEKKCILVEFESDNPGCEKAVISIFGNPGRDEISTSILPSQDGNLFVSGANDGKAFLSKISTDFRTIWAKEFKLTNFPNELIEKMILDSDGNLVAVGTASTSTANSAAFMFKYDPGADNLIWKTVTDDSHGLSYRVVREKSARGNYLVAGQNFPGDCRAILLEIDRNTGQTVGDPQEFSVGTCEVLNQMEFFNNGLIAGGRFTFGGSFGSMRPIFAFFDNSQNLVWAKRYLAPPAQNARLYMREFAVDGNDLYAQFFGDLNGTNRANSDLFLSKCDEDGKVEFTKRYEFPSIGFEGNGIIKAGDFFDSNWLGFQ